MNITTPLLKLLVILLLFAFQNKAAAQQKVNAVNFVQAETVIKKRTICCLEYASFYFLKSVNPSYLIRWPRSTLTTKSPPTNHLPHSTKTIFPH